MSVLKYKNSTGVWENISAGPSTKTGLDAPTPTTVANYVGQFYADTQHKALYVCTAITTEGSTKTYTWGNISAKQAKVTYTMAANAWDANNQYSFEALYPSLTYNVEVELSNTATSAQYKAYGKAGMTGNVSTNVITALGTVPTVDIPVILTVEVK